MGECPLSDPNLGIVSDVEHRAGACLCPLCTCGEHVCPGRRSFNVHMSFRTSYSVAFPRHKTPAAGKRRASAQTYQPKPWKLESESSMHRDFPPHPYSGQPPPVLRSLSPSLKPSVSVSSTHKDFPNWGPPGIVPTKHPPVRPTRLGELKFSGQSSYDLHYCTRSQSVDVSNTRPISRANSTTFRLSAGPGHFETTSKRSYETPSKWAVIGREKGPGSAIVQKVTPGYLRVSTMKSDYKAPLRMDPSAMLRRKLKHRLLL